MSTPSSLKAKLAKLGIRRQYDLVLHLPLRYEDETRLTPIAEAQEGVPVQVEGTVIDSQIAYRPRRQLVCKIEDGADFCICASSISTAARRRRW